jgi:hypothetical protein
MKTQVEASVKRGMFDSGYTMKSEMIDLVSKYMVMQKVLYDNDWKKMASDDVMNKVIKLMSVIK